MGLLGPLEPLILRSPLHGLLSGGRVLLTLDGGTTVARYAQRGDRLILLGDEAALPVDRLRGGAAVSVHLRGDSWTGRGSIVTGLDDIRRAQSVFEGTGLEDRARAPGVVLAEVVLD